MIQSRFITMAAVAVTLVLALTPAPAPGSAPAAAEPIDFHLYDLDGEPRSLSEFRGHWVVVNYWATWCAPCRKEIPDFSGLHDAREDITVLGLAYEDTEVDVFKRFLEDFPASYPILLVDVYDPPQALGAPRALPTTFLVDPDGIKVHTWIGPITSTEISAWIENHGTGNGTGDGAEDGTGNGVGNGVGNGAGNGAGSGVGNGGGVGSGDGSGDGTDEGSGAGTDRAEPDALLDP